MRSDANASASARPGHWRRAALAVFRKDMIETLRDRRTLIAAVLLPALTMPLVVLVMPALFQRQQQALRDRPARVAAVGEEAGRLAAAGERQGALRVVTGAGLVEGLLRGDLDAVLTSDAAGGRPGGVTVLYDASRPASAATATKLSQVAIGEVLRDLAAARDQRGTDPSGAATLPVVLQNVASAERMGGALLATALPLFLAVWVLLGGQHAALDVGVGERERGSLDCLLAAPPARAALVAGKFLAVLVPSVLALAVVLTSALAALALGAPLVIAGPVRVALPAGVALLLVAAGVALASLLSAAQLAVSVGARTLREAQQAFAGLYLVVALPTLLAPAAADLLEGSWVHLVPVVNAASAIRRLLVTGEASWGLFVTVVVLIVWTGPVLALAGRALERGGGPNR